MSLYDEFDFFVWFAVLAIPAIVLGCMEKKIKVYGFLVTLVFVYMALRNAPIALGWLALFCVYDYVLIVSFIKLRQKFGRNKIVYRLYLLASLLPLICNKLLGLSGNPDKIFMFLGISYLTFKGTQIIIEIFDGIVKNQEPLDYLYFMIFFPSITSGPIDRSRRFEEDLNNVLPRSEYLELVGTGIFKMVLGAFYKIVLAALFYRVMSTFGKEANIVSGLIYMYTYGFYLFFDFAGYSLMAIGSSYIFGIKTPDNFDKPFLSKDIKEFWDRWHITLSHWFRDFIFSRLMMTFMRNKTFNNKLTGASVGFIINMTVMGIWHGLTVYYILYGVYHGLLLAGTEIFQKKFKFYKKHKKERWFIGLSWFLTFNFVMFGFFIFSGRFTELFDKLI